MSKNEFLVLKKTLTEYLDKNFILINNSPAATTIFLITKICGSLRFCVYYRSFNRITKKKMPLIYENFRSIGKIKWYIKLEVRMAFHKIKITEKDELITAFRTKYGLFKWLVIPFGLANAFKIFQNISTGLSGNF